MLTNNNNIELETSLQQLMFNLLRDAVETDVGLRTNFVSGHFGSARKSRMSAEFGLRMKVTRYWRARMRQEDNTGDPLSTPHRLLLSNGATSIHASASESLRTKARSR